jgi:glyoxylase-like metal-dependent hydrolase (beta-lactamase superfamily II)
MGRRRAVILIIAGIGALRAIGARAADPPAYEVYAVRYATLVGYDVANLVLGADPKRKLDLAMTVWVLKNPGGRIALVDAGFYRPQLVEKPDVANFTRPDKALARLGIKPEEVTDVILTHMHWDHVDGADLFPRAQIWIQKDEYDHYTAIARRAGGDAAASELEHIRALVKLDALGRVRKVDGDAREIIPGVTVYTGGKHTFASQYVGVRTRVGTVVIASDNLYLYENLNKHIPIAATLDPKANLAAQDRMRRLAASPRLIIPGHDPEVFVRFPNPGDGVARVD